MTQILKPYGFTEIDSYISTSENVGAIDLDINTASEDTRQVIITGTFQTVGSTRIAIIPLTANGSSSNVEYRTSTSGATSNTGSADAGYAVMNYDYGRVRTSDYQDHDGMRQNFIMHVYFGQDTAPYRNTWGYCEFLANDNNLPTISKAACCTWAIRENMDRITGMRFSYITNTNFSKPVLRAYAYTSRS